MDRRNIPDEDEVVKLKDMVRKLQLQNEQLRSQNSRHDFTQNNVSTIGNENYIKRTESCISDLSSTTSAVSVKSDTLDDEERWLYTLVQNRVIGGTATNIYAWLRQDVDNNNDQNFQITRKLLIRTVEDFEQGLKRPSPVDTRTFTRPKKRITRPSLETMMEAPLYERQNLSPSSNANGTDSMESSILDLDSTVCHSDSSWLCSNLNNVRPGAKEEALLFQKIASDPSLSIPHTVRLDTTHSRMQEANANYQRRTNMDAVSTYNKKSEPCLNATFHKPTDLNATFNVHSRSTTPSGRLIDGNSSGGSNRSVRTASDDDQMSSASDSSFSSGTRVMNVGDVQNMARMQEESLNQVMSTPLCNTKREMIAVEDLPSPIQRVGSQDMNHGYQSDHSDHSSMDGRAISSRSSGKSSPGGSPFGSTHTLPNVPSLPQRELKLITPMKMEVRRAQAPSTLMQPPHSRPVSGLRPPATRARSGAITGLPRPTAPGTVSNIPRPPSRIPAPRIRSANPYSSHS